MKRQEQEEDVLVDDDVDVTIRISRAVYYRAWEIVCDPEMCPVTSIDEQMSVEEFLAFFLDEKLR